MLLLRGLLRLRFAFRLVAPRGPPEWKTEPRESGLRTPCSRAWLGLMTVTLQMDLESMGAFLRNHLL